MLFAHSDSDPSHSDAVTKKNYYSPNEESTSLPTRLRRAYVETSANDTSATNTRKKY